MTKIKTNQVLFYILQYFFYFVDYLNLNFVLNCILFKIDKNCFQIGLNCNLFSLKSHFSVYLIYFWCSFPPENSHLCLTVCVFLYFVNMCICCKYFPNEWLCCVLSTADLFYFRIRKTFIQKKENKTKHKYFDLIRCSCFFVYVCFFIYFIFLSKTEATVYVDLKTAQNGEPKRFPSMENRQHLAQAVQLLRQLIVIRQIYRQVN